MTVAQTIPRIVIAGAASNVGKTTITAGLIAALVQRGLVVQPFKCGPDYVDPSYHERAAGRPCRNLDAWMLSDEQILQGFARACADADIAVIEGVMGLFDGSSWEEERGSTAHMAKLLGAPVLLVVDISGAARSAAAGVLGCQHFDGELALRAVALNFAGSDNHAHGCAAAITRTTGLPVLGWLSRDVRLQIPERHLGLVPGGEHHDVGALLTEITREVTQRFDVDALIELARASRASPVTGPATTAGGAAAAGRVASLPSSAARSGPRPIVAVARDEAFCFYYPENLELLADAGAQIQFFSPLHGERPAANSAGVYLGGGYPELHGAALSSNTGLWQALQELHDRDAPIYAECGGFMVLMQGLVDGLGQHWPMAALLPGVARMTKKLAALGYRHATALRGNLLIDDGASLRGHEFRYSHWQCDTPVRAADSAWRVAGTRGAAAPDSGGYVRGNLLASYLHVHFAQRSGIAERFVSRCA